MHTRALIVIIIACFIVLQLFGGRVRTMAHDQRRTSESGLTDFELRKRNENAFARILGEFRTSAADMMFMKTELYLHGGMAWVPHLDAGAMIREGAVIDDTSINITSMIPPREQDFRGFIGDLERSVKPFDLEHIHERKDELLPWYRLMTTMDPHYMRGYRLGALWLIESSNHRRWDEALNFINEGLSFNDGHPEEFRLYVTKTLYYVKRNQTRERFGFPESREELLGKALEAARRAYTLGLRERPESGQTGEFGPRILWTDDLEEDFRFGARYVPIMLRELGRLDESMQAVHEVREVIPMDGPLRRFQRRLENEMLGPVAP